MCLAIPGKVIEIISTKDSSPFFQFAVVEISSVRRKVNIELIKEEGVLPGDWVLVHVGFALEKISYQEAQEQLQMLSLLGEEKQFIEEIQGYRLGKEREDGPQDKEL
ncbi:HypC/HybG/HupF family hydrogenase formation chaperone [Methylacidiphilum caldifontis]|uniref:Hydrogenase assembly protein HypC n=1 Tax=Methylacidiphilum caldifontis TaxID=2795386 RepID=A0A4Y8PF81_9BACT|nr:HypC/HybG/HupF family hydrogenase formation chaperone [Methylacidiphilum caldifontis]QSR88415.1 HypC/HybG/HupF family hydrogenase formation chaperone [Methylacidiphilum caldifontis]TFE70713.1 hydrogenase assembly protein HypC [Methylacidiphilum caldifontis]